MLWAQPRVSVQWRDYGVSSWQYQPLQSSFESVLSDTATAPVRSVNRAEHARVEETVVYHSCKYETTPWALCIVFCSPSSHSGCLIKINK